MFNDELGKGPAFHVSRFTFYLSRCLGNMSEHDLEKLLGGFAVDTLTPEEKKALYTAALQDQQLFNALTDEQALKELLADPVVRRRLLQTFKQTSTSGVGGSLSWLDWLRRPAGDGPVPAASDRLRPSGRRARRRRRSLAAGSRHRRSKWRVEE